MKGILKYVLIVIFFLIILTLWHFFILNNLFNIKQLISKLIPDSSVATYINFPSSTPKPTYPVLDDIKTLAEAAQMTDKGKEIFYSTKPSIITDKSIFANHCRVPISNSTFELGCYTSDNRIYILKISDNRLSQEMIVVASHELLHAVYANIAISEKKDINKHLEAVFNKIKNPTLTKELKLYKDREPGERYNELHSIEGTEYFPLDSYLENYYSNYFLDRRVLVEYQNSFNQVFEGLQKDIDDLSVKIKELQKRMKIYMKNGNIDRYNALVSEIDILTKKYNDYVYEYNDLRNSLGGYSSI